MTDDSCRHSTAIGSYPSCYHYGSRCPAPDGSPIGLPQLTSFEEFVPILLPLFHRLHIAVGQLPSEFTEVILRILESVCEFYTTRRTSVSSDSSDELVVGAIPAPISAYLSEVVVPSMCLGEAHYTLNSKLWGILKLLPMQRRYAIYSAFFCIGRFAHRRVTEACAAVRQSINREMKRMTAEPATESSGGRRGSLLSKFVSCGSVLGRIVIRSRMLHSQKEKNVINTLAELASINPFEVRDTQLAFCVCLLLVVHTTMLCCLYLLVPLHNSASSFLQVFDVLLHQVEFLLDSMTIAFLINYLPSLSEFSCDVAAFLITERLDLFV